MPSHPRSNASFAIAIAIAIAACGADPSPPDAYTSPDAFVARDAFVAPDASIRALLVGEWAQPAPATAVMRLAADGTTLVAVSRAELDTMPFASGTWTLEGHRLTFTNTGGVCAMPTTDQVGVYDVDVTETSLTFVVVDDPCSGRNLIDGQTWARLP